MFQQRNSFFHITVLRKGKFFINYYILPVPDVTMTYIRGWMQMVLLPYDLFSWKRIDTTMRYMNIAFQNIDNVYSWGGKYLQHIMYSVHDGSSLSRLTLLPSLPIAPWGCCPYPHWWSTAYLALRLGGRGSPPFPLPGLTPFPSGSRHLLASLLDTLPIAIRDALFCCCLHMRLMLIRTKFHHLRAKIYVWLAVSFFCLTSHVWTCWL